PLTKLATSAVAVVLLANGHAVGWPFPRGGAQKMADALATYFTSNGGELRTGVTVRSMDDLPAARAVLFDVTPRQLLSIAGESLSSLYRWQLRRYRYGMGVFKIDWALNAAVPFLADVCQDAGTVHLGGTYHEIANAERAVWSGRHPEK